MEQDFSNSELGNIQQEDKIVAPLFYLGPVSYFAKLCQNDKVTYEVCENFPKQTYRNRCRIMGVNGALNLVIPVRKKGERVSLKETEVAYDERWQRLHWKSMEMAYRSSPYFEFYEEHFAPFYRKKPKWLIDITLPMHELVLELLRVGITHELSTNYTEPKDAKDIRWPYHKKKGSISLLVPPYDQVFAQQNGFITDLSIVDLLFNEGPNALEYLRSAVQA